MNDAEKALARVHREEWFGHVIERLRAADDAALDGDGFTRVIAVQLVHVPTRPHPEDVQLQILAPADDRELASDLLALALETVMFQEPVERSEL